MTTHIPLKLLEFNVYDDINTTGDNYNKYKDNREFMVQMFGINQAGKTFSIFVEGFTPFFYVMVDDTWDNSKRVEFIKDISIKMGQYYENSIVSSQLIKRKKLYGFDAGKLHNFIQIVFKNTMALNKARKLWYKETITKYTYSKILRPEGYIFDGKNTLLYEGNIPPLLRLFHIKNISPSGWIGLPKGRYLRHTNKSTYCDYEFTVNYKHIMPLDKNVKVPYKQCSFDIEASSSHGDFPLAIKNYKKLATDITDTIAKIPDFDENTLQNMILTAFGIDVPETDISGNITLYRQTINHVYPKKMPSQPEIIKMFNDWIQLIPANIKYNQEDDDYDASLDEEASDSEDDENCDDTDHNLPNSIPMSKSSTSSSATSSSVKRYADKTATVIDMLKDPKCDYKMRVAELTKTLSIIFPKLEGDKITFIGSSFKRYGETCPYINHCIVLRGCDIPKNVDNPVIETYDTEEEVLMAWTRLINRENPDIVIGYNINGFDFDFMDKRSRELNCRREFLKLSRNREEVCLNRDWKTGKETIETTKILLASGEYNLKFFKMTGRVIIDLYNYFRREYQLGSYKLDNVAGHFIGDDVKRFEHTNTNDIIGSIELDDNDYMEDKKDKNDKKTIIYSKNLKGLDVGSYVHFEEISYSTDYYRDGAKFAVERVVMDNNDDIPYFVINGHETLDMSKKVRWCIAKDDVSPQEIFKLANGDDHDRSIVAKYCIHDCTLVQDIMDKIDLLTDFSEMSNYCSVPTSFLVFRGQGIKLTSYIAKKCREKDTLMPTIEKQENDGGYEGAIVLQPKSDMYLEDPVACVDYSSLYPSSIISENLSHDSKVWTREYDLEDNLICEWGEKCLDNPDKYRYDNLPEYKYVDVVYDTYKYVRKTPKAAATKVKSGYKICRFAQFPDGRKAIMPSVLEELLSARKATKKLAAQETDPFMKNILDKRQLTIKVTANSLYGQTGARTSTFYEKDVAASTTATGRKLLLYAVKVIETAYKNRVVELEDGRKVKTDAEYVYGDTDSVFFKFNLTDPISGEKIINREALGITIELAKRAGNLATKFLKRPHDLEYEKTFWPWCLLSKKRYVGMLYEDDPDKGKIKFMGIVLKRRDNAPIVKDIYGGIIDIIMKERNIERTIEYVKTCLQNIVDEKYPMDKLIVAKALRGFYKNPNQIAHNVLANRIGEREQGNRPKSGDRIPYVYIVVENKKALQGEKIETPQFIIANNLRINYAFYITNQIMKPIQQLFALVLENMPEFKKKYGYSLRKWDDAKQKLREKWVEEEKYVKKYEELRCKEVKAILFDQYLNKLK